MTTVEELKKLAAKITGKPVKNVTGETIPEVIAWLTANYTTQGG